MSVGKSARLGKSGCPRGLWMIPKPAGEALRESRNGHGAGRLGKSTGKVEATNATERRGRNLTKTEGKKGTDSPPRLSFAGDKTATKRVSVIPTVIQASGECPKGQRPCGFAGVPFPAGYLQGKAGRATQAGFPPREGPLQLGGSSFLPHQSDNDYKGLLSAFDPHRREGG